jgi:2-(1,2-epoxy-1,2-dihydrophenyl)acetyl-CoA isomerase
VEGFAAGAGMCLALGCDIVVADDGARFVASHLKVGVVPDWGATWLLPRLVGQARSRAFLLTGRPLTAPQAAAWGLIAESVGAGQLDEVVDGYCRDLLAMPPLALSLARSGIDRSYDFGLDAFLEWESAAVALALVDPEHRRRVQEFLSKRR